VIWRIGFYVSLVVVAVGLVLLAIPFFTRRLDTNEGKVAFAQGQMGLKSVRIENVSMESSPFKYYIVTATPQGSVIGPFPLRIVRSTGAISLYLYPNQLVFTSSAFGFPHGGTMISVPISGVYAVEADVIGMYWMDSDSVDVEVTSMSKPLLIIGPAISVLGVVALAGVLIMLRRHRITVYGLTLEDF
jgi:hypothetical protein